VSTIELLKDAIRTAENEIQEIDSEIKNKLPRTADQLHALHELQDMYRSNISLAQKLIVKVEDEP
jgi:Na+/phosphate symporter